MFPPVGASVVIYFNSGSSSARTPQWSSEYSFLKPCCCSNLGFFTICMIAGKSHTPCASVTSSVKMRIILSV